MYGYIYKITDLSNNKIYIGKHKAQSFEGYKYTGSGKIIRAIKNKCKVNKIPLFDRLKIEMIDTADTLTELNEKEIYYINQSSSLNSYNLTKGGDGGDTTCDKIKITNGVSERMISKSEKIPNGWIRGSINSGVNHGRYGTHFCWINNKTEEKQILQDDPLPDGYAYGRILEMPKESREKISQSRSNKVPNWSQETIQKHKDNWVGDNNPSVKHRKFGEDNPFFGKHHSQESKNKNSESHKIKYKCPYCNYVSNKSCVTKHIKLQHIELLESASTIESITYEKYIGE